MNEVLKIKPEMLTKEEMDEDLLSSLRFLLLELRTISPFFGVLATEMWIAGPSKNIPTIGVSERGVVSYNEDFIRGLTPGERVAVMVHEALHVALDYWDRFRGRNWNLANKAHDFAINDIIVKAMSELKIVRKGGKEVFKLGVRLPKGGLWDPKYDGMSGEEIYTELFQKVNERSKQIREAIKALQTDPVAKAAHERQLQVNQALRKSLIEAAKRVGEKEAAAGVGAESRKSLIANANREFNDLLRNAESISMKDTAGDYQREANNPYDNKPEPQQGEASNKGEAGNDSSNEQQGDTPSDEKSPQKNPANEAKEKLKDSMREAVKDYLNKEKDRIEQDVDQGKGLQPQDQSLEHQKNLEDLDNKLDQIKDDFLNDKNKAKEEGEPDPDGLDSNESLSEELADSQAQNGEPQSGQEPGDGAEPGEGTEPGQQGKGQEPGQSMEGGNEGELNGNDASGSSSSSEAAPGSASGVAGKGKPQQGSTSKEQAQQDAYEAFKELMDEMSNTLSGREEGMDGVNKDMFSGKDLIEEDAFEQAMKELNDELGTSGMEGDVDMDCSDIPNNPYSKETLEELNNRRMQMLQRAVVEDMQAGGQGVGTLPGWMKSEIEGILNPPMSFHEEIQKFFGPYGAKSKRSYSARNKRNTFQPNTVYMPGSRSNTSMAYILLDVSGSMMKGKDLDNLRYALGLVQQMAEGQQMEVCVVQADTGVTRVMTTREALDELNSNQFEVHGLGGSNLNSAFEFIWKEIATTNGNRGNPIIVFTDGAIVVPEEPPYGVRQQTLWVTCQGQNPPTKKWGDHIVMNDL